MIPHTAQGGKALGTTRPAFRLVVISDDADLLQGFIETSGMAVPAVEHGHPDDSDHPDLANGSSI